MLVLEEQILGGLTAGRYHSQTDDLGGAPMAQRIHPSSTHDGRAIHLLGPPSSSVKWERPADPTGITTKITSFNMSDILVIVIKAHSPGRAPPSSLGSHRGLPSPQPNPGRWGPESCGRTTPALPAPQSGLLALMWH